MAARNEELKNLSYELFILAVSVLSVFNIAIAFLSWDPVIETIAGTVNLWLSIVFAGDFVYRLVSADSASKYLFQEFGWADLASAVPIVPIKIMRLFSVFRTGRPMRKLGLRTVSRRLIDGRAESVLLMVAFFILCVLEFGAMGVFLADRSSPDANIKTAGDALWWGYVTIATVGYGDYTPVTNLGREIGVLVMTSGFVLLGTMTGYLARSFLMLPSKRWWQKSDASPDDPRAGLQEVRRLLAEQRKTQDDLIARVDEIEKLL